MNQSNSADRDARRRTRRRTRAARTFDTSIPSPCIAVCQIDDATDCCIGCFRSIDEIRDWPIMTANQKTQTLARIEQRKTVGNGPVGKRDDSGG